MSKTLYHWYQVRNFFQKYFYSLSHADTLLSTPFIQLPLPLTQGDYDGRGQPTAPPMLTAIMSGGVGISGRELPTQLINSLEQANHSFS